MPREPKEIAAELYKKLKSAIINTKPVSFTPTSSPQLPSSHSRRRKILQKTPPPLPDVTPYSGISRPIQPRLFPQLHKTAVTELSPFPNRRIPPSAYMRCSGCNSVFCRPRSLSIVSCPCPHCDRVHYDPEVAEECSELVKEVEQDEADGGMAGETFTDYRPSKLSIGHTHPDAVVETSSLSAVQPPEPTYNPKIINELKSLKRLSCLQIETLVYACQRHLQHIQSGARAGFFIGDGAGVGKGRTIAGLIWENWQHGRKKALWISVSSDLKYDAIRDLDDMGASCIEVHALNKLPHTTIGVRDGVIFSTYHSLISSPNKDRTRMKQLVDWCGPGFDGLIIFDECHKAKNLVPEKKMKPTKIGKAVLDIQAQLPEARVVYCSATGASEPRNMAYMVRLGLWGDGTYFHGFGDFLEALEKGGVGALELVAMDMKARGMYLCRTLSYKGAEFEIIEATLDKKMTDIYKKATEFWVDLREKLVSAIAELPEKHNTKLLWRLYWSSQQRFFRHLCMSAKVPTVVRLVKQALKEDKCVVIGLQSTGEARTEEAVSKYGSKLDDFISGPRELLLKFVEDNYPADSPLLENPKLYPAMDSKKKVLERIHALDLPNNPLDDIIDQLGGQDKVAEITGRKRRLERDPSGTGFVYRNRNAKNVTTEMVNMNEKKLFLEGEKLVVIISEAGSAGVSLHADKRVKNLKRRVHITLELPWSADRAIQQFGRTHRSNQVSAPEYRLLFTDLGGERRFASAVAKRLESLGALTQGDRRAGPSLSAYNYDSAYGKKALKILYTGIMEDPLNKMKGFIRQAKEALDSVGMEDIDEKQNYKVARFLNRLLGIAPEIQNRLFEKFVHIIDDLVQKARIEGNLDIGIVDLKANVIELQGTPKTVYVDQTSGASTVLFTFILDRRVSWELANTKLNEKQKAEFVSSGDGFYISKRQWLGEFRVILAFESSNSSMYKIVRPTTGESRDMHIEELTRKYTKDLCLLEAKIRWEDAYKASSKHCLHGPNCKLGNLCSVGSRIKEVNVLGGAILPVWGNIQAILSNQARQMHKMIRIVRVETTSDNRRIVGLNVPNEAVETVLEELDY